MSKGGRVIHGVRRLWWRWRRPVTRGARVVLHDDAGRVCLVRHSYLEGWYLPGGGLRRGEIPGAGARREAREELGIEVELGDLIGTYANASEGKRDTIWVFAANPLGEPRPASAEVSECAWFAADGLPPETSPATARRIEEWAGHRQPAPRW